MTASSHAAAASSPGGRGPHPPVANPVVRRCTGVSVVRPITRHTKACAPLTRGTSPSIDNNLLPRRANRSRILEGVKLSRDWPRQGLRASPAPRWCAAIRSGRRRAERVIDEQVGSFQHTTDAAPRAATVTNGPWSTAPALSAGLGQPASIARLDPPRNALRPNKHDHDHGGRAHLSGTLLAHRLGPGAAGASLLEFAFSD